MAVPIAAALKVVLAEQLHERDTASADTGPPEDGEAAEAPGTDREAAAAPTIGTAGRGH